MNKNNIVKWVGTILIMISAIIIAFYPKISLHWEAFVGYTFGALVWFIIAIKSKDYPLAILNIFYFIVDVYAIYIRV